MYVAPYYAKEKGQYNSLSLTYTIKKASSELFTTDFFTFYFAVKVTLSAVAQLLIGSTL